MRAKQMKWIRALLAALMGLSGAGVMAEVSQAAAPTSEASAEVETMVTRIAKELAQVCPIKDAADQEAFDRCRKTLFKTSALKNAIGPKGVLWGRQAPNPQTPLKESNLTQFSADTWSGMYAPLFMFTGESSVTWVPREKMWVATLPATFRNRLTPGQFPYPFWHEKAKWSAYENANGLLLWISPEKLVRVAQFSWQNGPLAGIQVTPANRPEHDGKWLWTDAQGRTQPSVTLFDGLYSPSNPNLSRLESSYKDFALKLRESQCFACHVPNNPEKSKRLVLLQTPAHAAGEIERIMKSVREDRMPREEGTGAEAPLDHKMKEDLLQLGSVFEAAVKDAKAWEKDHPDGQ